MNPPTNQFEQTQQAGIAFLPLIRPCDDPTRNFQKIKDRKLWQERERKREDIRKAMVLNPKIIS